MADLNLSYTYNENDETTTYSKSRFIEKWPLEDGVLIQPPKSLHFREQLRNNFRSKMRI
jgi:hypothetical protein